MVLAGGTGTRVGLDVPKQLAKVAGKTVIEHTLCAFEASPDVDDVLVLMHRDHIAEAERIVRAAGLRKVRAVLAGGPSRGATARRAVDVLSGHLGAADRAKILLHDAVRPLVSQRVISECVAALDTHGAVDVAVPASDTIIDVDAAADNGGDGDGPERVGREPRVTRIPDRCLLRHGQTPQGFRLPVLRRAHELAARGTDEGAAPATDDCAVVLRYLPDVPITVVRGDAFNLKITHPLDLLVADKLFQLRSQEPPVPASSASCSAGLRGRTMVVFGPGYGVDSDLTELAESYGCRVMRFSATLTGTHVDRPDDIASALAHARLRTGRIDFVVIASGQHFLGDLVDVSLEDVRRATAVNYLAPVHIARAAHSHLAESRGQLLLFTASSYVRGRARHSLHSSTKAAVVNFTQALAEEWAPDGIRVNCVNPDRPAVTPEPPAGAAGTPLTSRAVAQTALDVLVSASTGHVFDVRPQTPVMFARPAPLPRTTPL
ncbi:SDR family oxidoreductase [Streptomyces sp. NPDC050504]|uniref:SDR family oxidoreductase n=1 Tax=Streptomyces sp. NPDC050504 TaxID=3365618 RepID=UPI0037B0EC66